MSDVVEIEAARQTASVSPLAPGRAGLEGPEGRTAQGLRGLTQRPGRELRTSAPGGWALARLTAPAPPALALAAGSFLAGAAMVGLVGHRRGLGRRVPALRGRNAGHGARRAVTRAHSRQGPRGELVRILGTRSLLLDIHLLGAPER